MFWMQYYFIYVSIITVVYQCVYNRLYNVFTSMHVSNICKFFIQSSSPKSGLNIELVLLITICKVIINCDLFHFFCKLYLYGVKAVCVTDANKMCTLF